MNLAALTIGLVLVMIGIALKRAGAGRTTADLLLIAVGTVIPLTALLGAQSDGVARWLIVAGVTVQPALILVPPLVVAFALRASAARTAAIGIASAGVALQPDPAAAAMLALGVACALVRMPRSAAAITALGFACAGLAVAIAGAIALPPVPFVEGVLPLAFQSGAAASVAAVAAITLLFIPAFIGRGAIPLAARLAYAGVWAAAIVASVVGAYPTPVAGYGGSAVLGYILSVGILWLQSQSALRSSHSARLAEAASDQIVRFAWQNATEPQRGRAL